jgi:hypothetical protein
MTAFSRAMDEACDKLAAELGRDPGTDEIEHLEDALLRCWIDAGHFADLVAHAQEEFELQDGEAFCASLGNALCKAQHAALAEQLFTSLAQSREAAFWRVWPKAELGQIGAMKEASIHLANAMKAMAELCRCQSLLSDEYGMQRARDEMLRLQQRRKRAT